MRIRERQGYYLFVIPGILLFLIIIFYPFIFNCYLSFAKWSGTNAIKFIGLKNYARALTDSSFWTSLKNNVIIVLTITILPTFIGFLLSVLLFNYVSLRISKGAANFFRFGFYLPQVIPSVIIGVVWKWIYQPNWGALNVIFQKIGLEKLAVNWLGDPSWALISVLVTMIWFQIGYPLVIFISALQRIDHDIIEAAWVDGAKGFNMLYRITLPLISPEVFVVVLTTIIYALKIFGPVFIMTQGGPGNSTMVASYFAYKYFFEMGNVGYGATMSTILSFIIFLVAFVYLRLQTKREGEVIGGE